VQSHLRLFNALKVKEMIGKESKFSPAQVLDILLRKWFLLESKIVLLKSNLDDEDDDLKFFDPDSKMKLASLKAFAQSTSIHLDSTPNMQWEGTQQPPDVHFGFILEQNLPVLKLNLLSALRS
jgi:hypothetical protein